MIEILLVIILCLVVGVFFLYNDQKMTNWPKDPTTLYLTTSNTPSNGATSSKIPSTTKETTPGKGTTSTTPKPANSNTSNAQVASGIVAFTFDGETKANDASLVVGDVPVQGYDFKYGTTRNEGTANFHTTYFWFCAKNDGKIQCNLKLSGRWKPVKPYVGAGGQTIPITTTNDGISFILPEPKTYFYIANVDDMSQLPAIHIYFDPSDVLSPPPGAKIIKKNTYNQDTFQVDGVVYLEPGVVIKGSGGGGQFVKFSNNSKLLGAGIIDTNNNYTNICEIGAKNVSIVGPMFRKSKSFGFVVTGNVVALHCKVFTGVDGGDGIGAQGYQFRKGCMVAVDDCFAHKTHRGRACRDILVEDVVMTGRKSAMKLGTESNLNYDNIIFNRCTVYGGCRFISLYLVDGGKADNIKFTNLIGLLIRWPGEGRSGRFIDCDGASVATNKRQQQNSPLTNCVIENVWCKGVKDVNIQKLGDPTQITLKNVMVDGITSINSPYVTGTVSRATWPPPF